MTEWKADLRLASHTSSGRSPFESLRVLSAPWDSSSDTTSRWPQEEAVRRNIAKFDSPNHCLWTGSQALCYGTESQALQYRNPQRALMHAQLEHSLSLATLVVKNGDGTG